MQEDKIVKRIPTNLVTKTIITSSAEYEPNKEYTDEDANIYEKYLQAITNVSIGINGDIEKIKALEDNILDQYNKNVELADKMEQETEKFAKQANTAIEDYNSNAETKAEEFNTNAKEKTNEFNSNATEKETEISDIADGFDANVEEKTNTFNSNVETKTTEFNNNSNAKTEEFNNNSTEKINAFNSNAEEKIAEYDAHAESVLTETEDLFNALDTEKASGTELYIEDAKPCRAMNTEIDGMYKQETTKGDQLVDYNNISQSSTIVATFINDELAITSTTGKYSSYSINILNIVKNNPGKTLYFNCKNYDFSKGYNCCVQYVYKKNGVINYDKLMTKNGAFYPIKISNDISDITVASISFYSNNSGNEVEASSASWTKPMLSFTPDAEYESYTGGNPSPNSNYLQEIEQVDTLQLQCVGSNLLNYTQILGTPSSTSGIVVKLQENGDITISGKIKYSYVSIIKSTDIIDILKDGETYYLDQSNYNRFFYTEIQCVKEDGSRKYIGPQKSACAFKVDKNLYKKYVLRIICGSMSFWGEEERTITSNFKLTRQKNMPFEKYISKTINVDLKGNKLCAVSDTIKDKLLIDKSGNVALQKNVNYSTFSAFNSINGSFTKSTQFILNISNCVKNVGQNSFNALSNCMLKNTTDGGMGFYGTTTSGNVRITVLNSLLNVTQEDTTSTKLNAAKTFLQNLQQTPEIYYPAEVPELIDLGQLPELLKTFNGINNVWAETNLGNTEIEIEYVQDVKKLLEKQAEQQNARLDNIEALLSTTETSALLLDNMQNDLEKEVE